MRKVSQKEFYQIIGPQDVCLRISEFFPYTTEFYLKHSNKVIGKTVDSYRNNEQYKLSCLRSGQKLQQTEYFLI
jgi:phosphoenolpyruvate synthase/pyruvate phosphate dikinase